MDKIRVLYIISTLERCGPVNVLYEMVKNIDMEIFHIEILTLSPEPKDSRYEEFIKLGVKVTSIGMSRLQLLLNMGKRLKEIVEAMNPHIVHSHGYRADLLSVRYLMGYKRVNTIHNYAPYDYTMQYGKVIGTHMARRHLKAILKLDNPIACSQFIENKLKQHNIKVDVVQNGIDKDKYSVATKEEKLVLKKKLGLATEKLTIASVGALIDRKDPLTVLKGFNKSKVKDEMQLVLVGEGPLFEQCKATNLQSVILTGKVNNVHEYLKAADVFISASKAEGLPMAVLEAMASGLMVILSDIEPHKELVGNNPAISQIFKLGDTEELSNIINSISKADLSSISLKVRQHLELNFSSEVMSNKYTKVYRNILSLEDR